MVDLDEFRENARKENLCEEYTKIWDGCKNNKQLMDMALGAKGADYLCASIAQGWGISPIKFLERFSSFVNGRYISNQDGYDSKIYCRYVGRVEDNTTLITLIDSIVNIDISDENICELYCVGDCEINLTGNGRVVIICYGNPDKIIVNGTCGNVKRINKKDRDRYE